MRLTCPWGASTETVWASSFAFCVVKWSPSCTCRYGYGFTSQDAHFELVRISPSTDCDSVRFNAEKLLAPFWWGCSVSGLLPHQIQEKEDIGRVFGSNPRSSVSRMEMGNVRRLERQPRQRRELRRGRPQRQQLERQQPQRQPRCVLRSAVSLLARKRPYNGVLSLSALKCFIQPPSIRPISSICC